MRNHWAIRWFSMWCPWMIRSDCSRASASEFRRADITSRPAASLSATRAPWPTSNKPRGLRIQQEKYPADYILEYLATDDETLMKSMELAKDAINAELAAKP